MSYLQIAVRSAALTRRASVFQASVLQGPFLAVLLRCRDGRYLMQMCISGSVGRLVQNLPDSLLFIAAIKLCFVVEVAGGRRPPAALGLVEDWHPSGADLWGRYDSDSTDVLLGGLL